MQNCVAKWQTFAAVNIIHRLMVAIDITVIHIHRKSMAMETLQWRSAAKTVRVIVRQVAAPAAAAMARRVVLTVGRN